MKEISIIIPVYNSEDCLKELYNQIKESVDIHYEVILVNDQSNDNSWDVITALAKENKNVVGINLRKNAGQDNAIMAGLSKMSGHYAVIMDDDLQHSPSEIKRLYDKCREGYDVCYAKYDSKKQKIWKNLGSWLNGKIAECMLRKPIELYLSPFKIIKREIVENFRQYDGPYPYIDGLILSFTNHIAQIDTKHNERYSGQSNYSLMKSLRVWSNHMTGFSVVPLRVATFIGILSAIAGFILGVYYIFFFLTTENMVEGWTTIVVIILFLGGLMLLSLGLIGEYVGRSYLVLNHKPQFNIKEIIGES